MIRKICLTLVLGAAFTLNAQWGGWGDEETTSKDKVSQSVDLKSSSDKPAAPALSLKL